MPTNLGRRVDELLDEITQLVELTGSKLTEEAQLHRQGALERIVRRVRERGTPLTRNVLRARRERKQRSRYHALKDLVTPPRKLLSTRVRSR